MQIHIMGTSYFIPFFEKNKTYEAFRSTKFAAKMLLNINVKFLWKLQQRLSSNCAGKRSDMSLCFQNSDSLGDSHNCD